VRNYWSNTKFAGWLRGTDKPQAETSKGWREWNAQAKKSHPVRYWIAEELLDRVQSFLRLPIDAVYGIKYYINNRWVTRTHGLTAHPRDIKPGTWCDVGYRFLPCLFNELVNFVEVELAWWHLAWEGQSVRDRYNMPWWAVGWWRVRIWRCPAAGLDNLRWQMGLVHDEDWIGADDPRYGKPTLQAESAKEIYELYDWWVNQRPRRPDPYDASGWSEICARRRADGKDFLDLEDRNEAEREETRQALDLCHKIETEQEAEDEAMMIRLIKIRRALWT
jgi:hypothetical protein